MTAADEARARLIERLLSDPAFRTRFQADPAGAAREAGLGELADELEREHADPMQTLDLRESRSSLAGAFMAAAIEGAGIYEFFNHVPLEDAAQASPGRPGGSLTPVDDVPVARASGSGWDPDQFGQHGFGGPVSADTLLLLRNRNIVFDAAGIADLKAGRVDPRVVTLLQTISERHRITVSAMSSDHTRLTAGGSVSNHYYGRAVDIATVDGRPVGPGNAAAHRLAVQLSRVNARIRPSEIGSPWPISGAAYFTDGDHQDHIHVGFDEAIDASWRGPSGAPSPRSAAVAALPTDPDDWEGNLDDEDAGDDEVDGSNEDEADEGGGEDDDGGSDDEEGSDDEDSDDDEDDDEDSDDDEDAPGEGSNGEDADDSESDGDDSDDADSDDGDDSDDSDDEDSDTADSGVADDGQFDLGAVDGYPGDDAPRADVAAWMGSEAQKRGLPPELPVMASLVESGLRNLDHGDADSVGYFQMRLSIWNQGEYVGYSSRPDRQLEWFLDHALAVKKQRLDRGLPVDDPRSYGEWVADVERPAAEYRGRYQLRLDDARSLLRRADPRPSGGQELLDAAGGGGITAGPRALVALSTARKELGTPYLWGGSSPQTGFDCSGLVQWAYAKAGIQIPRVAADQFASSAGERVGSRALLPGDLVFFQDSSGYVHHVGISLGGDRFLHSPHTGDVVKISSLRESYYAQEFAGGRRFDHAGALAAQAVRPAEVSASAVADARAVKLAEDALERDAAEVQRLNSVLFLALQRQESGKGDFRQLLQVGGPEQTPRVVG